MSEIEVKIRTRIDTIFSKYKISEEITELKEELIADLTEIANNEIKSGISINDAIDNSFNKLGDIDELMQEFDNSKKDIPSLDDENLIKIGKFKIADDKISYDGKVLIDDEKIDFGRLLKVEDNSVEMGNGFLKVNDNGVSLGKDTSKKLGKLNLVNSREFELTDIANIIINYKNDILTVGQSPSEKVIINEYMSKDNKRYYLNALQSNNQLTITQGQRPIMWHVRSKIEILMPINYHNNFVLVNKNGRIDINNVSNKMNMDITAANGAVNIQNLNINSLILLSSNGAINMNDINLDKAQVLSNNGSIIGNNLKGNYDVKTKNGTLKITSITGSGNFSSNNGTVKVDFLKITGDTNMYTKNGTVNIEISENSSLEFVLQSKSGIVKSNLTEEKLKYQAQGFIQGQLGKTTNYKLEARSDHGTVKLLTK